MYNIYADGVLIHHSQSPDPLVKVIDPKLKRSDNAAGSLTMKIPPSNPGYETIKRLSTEIVVKRVEKSGEKELWSGRVIDESKDFWNNRSLTCEGELGYLNDTSQPPAEYHDISVKDFLKTLIDIHNVKVENDYPVSIKFNTNSATESEHDYLAIYYPDGIEYAAGVNAPEKTYAVILLTGNIGGTVVNIPTNKFYLCWYTDISANNYYGYKIDSIERYYGSSFTNVQRVGADLPNRWSDYPKTEYRDLSNLPESPHNPYNNNSYELYYIDASGFGSKHAFKLGIVTVTDTDNTGEDSLYRYTNYESTLDCIIDKLVKRLGGHLRVRKENGTRYLDYLKDYPNSNTQTIEFGKNLIDFTRNWDMKDLATVVMPLGCNVSELGLESSIPALEEYLTVSEVNNNSPYVISDSAVKEYGWIETVVHFDDVTIPSNLLRKAKEYLEVIQFEEMVLELSAVDLHYFDIDVEAIDMLDVIHCVSTPHGMDKTFPITEIDIPLDKPDDTVFTLGDTERSTRGISASIRSTNNSIIDAINRLPSSTEVLSDARTHADELVNMKTNGFITIASTADEYGSHSEAMYISDNKDLEYSKKNGRYWVWNANGLAYYNKNSVTAVNPSGLKTAITMDGGIYGDFLKVGTISSVYNGSTVSSWNLVTGEFKTSNGYFTGNISGTNISGSYIYGSTITSGTYGTDNYTRISGGTFTTNNGTFKGSITASTISGTEITGGTISGSTITSGTYGSSNYTRINAGAFYTNNGSFSGTITGSTIYCGSYPYYPYITMGSDSKIKSFAYVDVDEKYGTHLVETGIQPGGFYSYIDGDTSNGMFFEIKYAKSSKKQTLTTKSAVFKANNFKFQTLAGSRANIYCGDIHCDDIDGDNLELSNGISIYGGNIYLNSTVYSRNEQGYDGWFSNGYGAIKDTNGYYHDLRFVNGILVENNVWR